MKFEYAVQPRRDGRLVMAQRRFRSATIYEGIIRMTTRSFLYALGQDDADIERPHVAVIHTGGVMRPNKIKASGENQELQTSVLDNRGTPPHGTGGSVADRRAGVALRIP